MEGIERMSVMIQEGIIGQEQAGTVYYQRPYLELPLSSMHPTSRNM